MRKKILNQGNKIVMFAKRLLNEHPKTKLCIFGASGSWRRRSNGTSHDTSSNSWAAVQIYVGRYHEKKFQWNDDSCVRFSPFQPIHESISFLVPIQEVWSILQSQSQNEMRKSSEVSEALVSNIIFATGTMPLFSEFSKNQCISSHH